MRKCGPDFCRIMESILLLVKLGEYRYMRRLYEDGELFLRPITDFCRMDEDDGIGDRFENVASFRCPPDPEITLNFPSSNIVLPPSSRIMYAEYCDISGFVYSMSIVDWRVDEAKNAKIINPDALNRIGIGYDTMVVVTDCKQFIERVCAAANKDGFDMSWGPVKYYPEKDCILDDLTPFHKRDKYAYQKEFRFFLESEYTSPLTLHIGNMADIAFIYRVKPRK